MFYNLTNRDGETTLSLFYENGSTRVVPATHMNFSRLVEYLTSNSVYDEHQVERLVDPTVGIGEEMAEIAGDRVSYDLHNLYFDGQPLHSVISDHIKAKIQAGDDDWKRLVRFLLNVDENPSYRAQQAVYNWVSRTGLTLTEDGCFLGYKAVYHDHFSVSSGPNNWVNGELYQGGRETRVPHEVGYVISKKRADVDDTPGGGCSVGLHVGTYKYASGFAPVLMTVKVNPRDVVSVPEDGTGNWKIRVCRYEVISLNEEKVDFIGRSTSYNSEPEETDEDYAVADWIAGDVEDEDAEMASLSEEIGDDLEDAYPLLSHDEGAPFTLAEHAEEYPALQDDLENVELGHKEVGRRWAHLTTESSVRRYRKTHGIVPLTSQKKDQ